MRDCNSVSVAVGFAVFAEGAGVALDGVSGEGDGMAVGTVEGDGTGEGDAVAGVARLSRCGWVCWAVANGRVV